MKLLKTFFSKSEKNAPNERSALLGNNNKQISYTHKTSSKSVFYAKQIDAPKNAINDITEKLLITTKEQEKLDTIVSEFSNDKSTFRHQMVITRQFLRESILSKQMEKMNDEIGKLLVTSGNAFYDLDHPMTQKENTYPQRSSNLEMLTKRQQFLDRSCEEFGVILSHLQLIYTDKVHELTDIINAINDTPQSTSVYKPV